MTAVKIFVFRDFEGILLGLLELSLNVGTPKAITLILLKFKLMDVTC